MRNGSILSRFVEAVGHSRDRTALVIGGESYTYGALYDLSGTISELLRAHHVKGGDRIGILTENSVYTYASILAVWSCGACYVPINHENPLENNVSIVVDAGVTMLLYAYEEARPNELSIAVGQALQLVATRVALSAHRLVVATQSGDDLCYLLFTSGTTGKPKGVPIYCRNLSSFMEMMLESGLYAFSSDDRFLQMFELTFDLSVFSFLVPLSVGASFYPLPQKGLAYLEVADVLETMEISVALMVPSVVNYLKPYFGEIALPKVRYSLFCGEALYHDAVTGWAECVPSARIENLYGPTEATIFCLRFEWQPGRRPHPDGKGIVPIGEPMPAMEAFLLKQNELDQEGELCLVGEQVTAGYWNNPSKTAEAFGVTKTGRQYYRTGDLCKVDQSGNFLYLGRIDNQVKIDGHRVELEEIEFHAREFCQARQVVAALNTTEAGLHFVVLFIESDVDMKAGVQEYLRAHLPAYMLPKEIVTVGLFPLNNNGKIDRKVLKERYLTRFGSQ